MSTYSFRLSYENVPIDIYRCFTDWEVYFKGHKHGVQPTQKEIDTMMPELCQVVQEYCIKHVPVIVYPGNATVIAGAEVHTKSAK